MINKTNIKIGASRDEFGAGAGKKLHHSSTNNIIIGNTGPRIKDKIENERLWIDIHETDRPLIGADFKARTVNINGNMELNQNLTVNGSIGAVGNVTGIISHATLVDMQGGIAGEYYHLTSAQMGKLHNPVTLYGAPLTQIDQQLRFNYDPDDFTVVGNNLQRKAHAYGSCWGNDLTWSQSAAQDTAYMISDAGIEDGELYLCTHDGSGEITVGYSGIYLINWCATLTVGSPNKQINVGVAIDSVKIDRGKQNVEANTANVKEVVSGTCFYPLTSTQTVHVYILCVDSGSPTVDVHNINLTVFWIGR